MYVFMVWCLVKQKNFTFTREILECLKTGHDFYFHFLYNP